MFRKIISESPFFNSIANDVFGNINGDTYRGDVSFVSSLRALLGKRMPAEDNIFLRYTSSSYSSRQLEGLSKRKSITAVYDEDYISDGTITIHNFSADDDSNNAWMDSIKANFAKVCKGYTPIEKFEHFFSQTMNSVCFIKPDTKNVVIFCCDLEIRTWHYLQIAIPVCLPWYFEEEKRLEKESDEHFLINSFREKDHDIYLKCLEKLAEPYNFRALKITRLLSGFETRYERIELERVRNNIDRTREQIREYNQRIKGHLETKRDLEIRLSGLENKIANENEGESEIMDFFLCNKNIYLEDVRDDYMIFVVVSTLDNYDEDAAEHLIKTKSSVVYKPNGRACNNIIPEDDMELLMRAIFVDQKLNMRLCARYRFSLNGNVTGVNYGNRFDSEEYSDCMPNPHIYRYSCLGGYEYLINEYLQENDYIGAITQCVASSKSINWNDPPVMREFISYIYGIETDSGRVNNRCVELPDGNVVTPKEAVEWLKENADE